MCVRSHRRVGLVDVLTTRAGGAKGVHSQISLVDVDGLDLVGLWQYGDRAGTGVDPPLGFCFGNALHAMSAALELQPAVHVAALYARHNFLVAAVFAWPCVDDLYLPATGFRVAAVHAMQITGENCRLVAARCRRGSPQTHLRRRSDHEATAASAALLRRCAELIAQPRVTSSFAISRMSGSSSACMVFVV